MKKYFITVVFALISMLPLFAWNQDDSDSENKPGGKFQDQEELYYRVNYDVAGIYVNAGTARFNVIKTIIAQRPVYHVIGIGYTNPKYDWLFKVRDRYESYFDEESLLPYKFIRRVNEGGHIIFENITFNPKTHTAVTTKGVYRVPANVHDVMNAIYFARNQDYSHMKPGDKIPFPLFLDNKIYHIYIRFIGKDIIKTKFGKFRAICFKPLLIKGTIFKGGEKMTVWVSDDENHVPLRVETPILVGKIKVDLMKYSNLKYPLSCRIE